jgi:hypothetical protein
MTSGIDAANVVSGMAAMRNTRMLRMVCLRCLTMGGLDLTMRQPRIALKPLGRPADLSAQLLAAYEPLR